MNLIKDGGPGDKDEGDESDSEEFTVKFEETLGKEMKEKANQQAEQQLQEDGFDMWFVCDCCMEPIQENLFRFDCTQCDNFTLCLKCYKKNTTHTHKFKKLKVPAGQGPPQNSRELIAKAFMMCCECGKSLIDLSKRVYVEENCSKEDLQSGNANYWCKDCKGSATQKLTKLKH